MEEPAPRCTRRRDRGLFRGAHRHDGGPLRSAAAPAARPADFATSTARSPVNPTSRPPRHAAVICPSDLFPAEPAPLEALFLPCPRGGMHRQGEASAVGAKVAIVTTNAGAPDGRFVLQA